LINQTFRITADNLLAKEAKAEGVVAHTNMALYESIEQTIDLILLYGWIA